MAEKENNIHAGHRQRVRDKFIAQNSLDDFADHNILEFLLFYSVPRADTNELAHRLIREFGSLKGVFDAPVEALMKVDGIGENTAVLIKLIPSLTRIYMNQDAQSIKTIITTQDAVNYLRPKFMGMRNEALAMLCLNRSGKILKYSVISKGGIDYTHVDTRKILFDILSNNATEIIIAHNHPGGLCAPSKADIEMTRMISQSVMNTGTVLRNHIIISENDYFSFADNSRMRDHLRADSNNRFIVNEDEEAL